MSLENLRGVGVSIANTLNTCETEPNVERLEPEIINPAESVDDMSISVVTISGSEHDSSSDTDDNTANNNPTAAALINSHDPTPNIGNVNVERSSNTQFGNRISYLGPVNINQRILHQNSSPRALFKKFKCSMRCVVFATIVTGLVATLSIFIALSMEHNPNKDCGPLRIVTRAQWFAKPPKKDLTPLQLPSIRVIIANTYNKSCSTEKVCANYVRNIQYDFMKAGGLDDIAYNFLIGGDGAVYVGRDWDRLGQHTRKHNAKSIGIAFIGKFDEVSPQRCQLVAAQALIAKGVQFNMLAVNYSLYGQRQLMNTNSPGLALFQIIETWPHFSRNESFSPKLDDSL